DVRLRLLTDAPLALEQNDEVDLFVGAAEQPARLTLLDRERLQPGETGWVQVRLREPVAVAAGDRFIVRRPSPSLTIGGGEIVDANPPRHRRFRSEVLQALETLAAGSPEEIVLQALTEKPVQAGALLADGVGGLGAERVGAALARLVADGRVTVLGRSAADGPPRSADALVATATWIGLRERLLAAVDEHHAQFPLRKGMPKEQLRSRLRMGSARVFDDVVATAVAGGHAADDGQTVRNSEFTIRLDPARRAAAARYLAALAAAPHAPPAPSEFGIEADTLGALVDRGEVVKVGDGVVYAAAAFAAIERAVLALIDRDGSLTLAAFRDHFGTSRKYAQATLEFLDQRRVTRRVGDERVRYAGVDAAVSARATATPGQVNVGRSDE
ncbi:MAG TPA: SelB C-terminal domain-containing protein, partial [Methylomirabilota bacterium]|nr:SelB C-terminal domain-containing protein [Methylomirabilota bacterium]